MVLCFVTFDMKQILNLNLNYVNKKNKKTIHLAVFNIVLYVFA